MWALLLLTKFILGFSREKACGEMMYPPDMAPPPTHHTPDMCDENEDWRWSLSWTALTPGIVMKIFSGLSKTEIDPTGSFCPNLHPPTPGHPCTAPGNLNCSYDGATITDNDHCCCGRCPDTTDTITMACVSDNSTTGAGLWSSPCPADCCGSKGEWWG